MKQAGIDKILGKLEISIKIVLCLLRKRITIKKDWVCKMFYSNSPRVPVDSKLSITLIGIAVLAVAIFVAYLPAMNAGFIWEDAMFVTANPLITAPDGLRKIWFSHDQPYQYFFPMVYTVFRLEYKLWQFNPVGYHITNILLHIVTTLLLWLLLSRLKIPGAWLAAAIFGLHPVQVESVAWVTELKNVLMATFYLLSILTWFEFVRRSQQAITAWWMYLLSLILYALALSTKPTAATMPAVLVLILWMTHSRFDKKRWSLIIPYLLLSLAAAAITMWWEYVHGMSDTTYNLNMMERILVAGRAIWFYIIKLFWPANLCISYPKWKISAAEPLQYLWLLACVILAVVFWTLRKKIGRGPITAFAFFVITLLPTIGILKVYTFFYTYVADHYQYIACIGPIALVAAAVYRLMEKFNLNAKIFAWAAISILLLISTVLTWRQCHIYKDPETIWRDTLKKNPSSLLANANLGLILYSQGKVDEAIQHYRLALETYQIDEEVLCYLAEALLSQGKNDEAIGHLNTALEANPSHLPAHLAIARAFKMQNKMDEAAKHLQIALLISPKNAEIYYNLANILRTTGHPEDALAHYKKAIELKPDFIGAYNNAGVVLELLGKTDEAEKHYRTALEINPNDVTSLINLGNILGTRGEIKESLRQYRKSLQYEPQSVFLLVKTAGVLMMVSDPNAAERDETVRLLNQAATLTGSQDPLILSMLASAYALTGQMDSALSTAKSAMELASKTTDQQLIDQIKRQLQTYTVGKTDNDKTQISR